MILISQELEPFGGTGTKRSEPVTKKQKGSIDIKKQIKKQKKILNK
jgi:hypothetical protein